MTIPFCFLGGILGYNISLIVSFVLSGVLTYAVTKHLTGNPWSGWLAGIAFAFTPYRMAHLMGHLNLMGTQWFPIYFWALCQINQRKQWSWKPVLVGALGIGLIALTSAYYFYMTVLISVVFVTTLLLLDYTALRTKLFMLGMLVIFSLPLVGMAMWPFLGVSGNYVPRSLNEVRFWSASPLDFIMPPTKHFLWGGGTAKLWVESTLYLSWVMLVFAVAAVKDSQRRPLWIALMVSSCFAIVLALGVELRWRHDNPTEIWLPGRWLFDHLPLYDRMRVWMRYGVFAILFVSLLGGIGFAFWQTWVKHKTTWGMAALLLLGVDIYTGIQPLSEVKPRAVDVWLAQQYTSGAVIELPFDQALVGQNAYYSLIHGKPTIGSFSSLPTPQLRRIIPVLAQFPSDDSFRVMSELGVKWVVISASRYADFENVKIILQEHGYSISYVPENPNGLWIFER